MERKSYVPSRRFQLKIKGILRMRNLPGVAEKVCCRSETNSLRRREDAEQSRKKGEREEEKGQMEERGPGAEPRGLVAKMAASYRNQQS